MKTTTLILILLITGPGLWAQMPRAVAPPATPAESTPPEEIIPPGLIDFASVDVNQVLGVYEKLVGRTLLRAPGLPLQTPIVLKTVTPLTKSEAIGALQAVLSMNGVEVINVGDKFVKVLPVDQAGGSGAKLDTNDVSQFPELGTYVTHIVHLNYVKPSAMLPVIAPFSKLPNPIVPLDENMILVLRDNAENVKRMLEMIAQVDVGGGGSEIISEVIPIRYALAEDIANALTSLGGGGGTVSIGGAAGAPTTTGVPRPGGIPSSIGGAYQPGANGYQGNQPRTIGGGIGSTPNGTPATGSSFQSRLLSIVNRASAGGQQEQIQIFGQNKIIADQRSNSLLIFATRQDMEAITNVIAKLDVLLSQVLIESVIIDVNLNKAMNLGVSAAQNPRTFSSRQGGIAGGGGFNNGPSFLNFLGTNASTFFSAGTNAAGALPSGLSYFGNIGPTWDVALQAAASDSSATVIQRPRIMTSQAKKGTFRFGTTVPYITSSYNGGSGIGASSSYAQLFVGVALDITPFINPDGLVVMDIEQEIDDLAGSTAIVGVGDVPNTTHRELNSEIAVKDKDTIMLGGFIRSDKSNNKSGVPYLQDIPLLGYLFTQHASTKDRSETIVLIRPTVLRTPDIASAQAIIEQKRLPGISRAAAEDTADELKQVEAEAKAEEKAAAAAQKAAEKGEKPKVDEIQPLLLNAPVDTNAVAPPSR